MNETVTKLVRTRRAELTAQIASTEDEVALLHLNRELIEVEDFLAHQPRLLTGAFAI